MRGCKRLRTPNLVVLCVSMRNAALSCRGYESFIFFLPYEAFFSVERLGYIQEVAGAGVGH